MSASAPLPASVVVVAQNLRLRESPTLEAFAPVILPQGARADLLALDPPGWAKLRVQTDSGAHIGYCLRRMLDEAMHAPMPRFLAAEARLWDLVQQYTGRVAYNMGSKAANLRDLHPTIDCSGWAAMLLISAMRAQNTDAMQDVFHEDDIAACNAWSDRIIVEIEARTPVLLQGSEISAGALRAGWVIGLNAGNEAWEAKAPRLRGVDHIVVIARRPDDGGLFVSESAGGVGVRISSLATWLGAWSDLIASGNAFAVNAFAMADPFSPFVQAARTS
jgi:hypothetical protein